MKIRYVLLVMLMLPWCSNAMADFRFGEKMIGSELTIQPGKWAMGRLRNIAANTSFSINVQTEGAIIFLILTESQLNAFPKVNDPLLMARVNRQFSATSNIDAGGNYYLFFWNKDRRNNASVKWQGQISTNTRL